MKNEISNLNFFLSNLLMQKYYLYWNWLLFLKNDFCSWVCSFYINASSFSLVCVPYIDRFYPFVFVLQKHTPMQFSQLLDITAIDFVIVSNRFRICYQLTSLLYNSRITLLLEGKEGELIPSLTALYRAATWFESEVWDLFGIYFYGNKHLRRLLTDYGFRFFPMKKDFPLSGYQELFYNNSKKRVGYYKLSVLQEYRNFTYNHVWL
jgi:NADH:ubiquinone oxidoreductase subunit C